MIEIVSYQKFNGKSEKIEFSKSVKDKLELEQVRKELKAIEKCEIYFELKEKL